MEEEPDGLKETKRELGFDAIEVWSCLPLSGIWDRSFDGSRAMARMFFALPSKDTVWFDSSPTDCDQLYSIPIHESKAL